MILSKKKALGLIELLIAFVLLALIVAPTVDVLSKSFDAQTKVLSSIFSKQKKISASERVVSEIKEAVYVYNSGTSLTIPTETSSTEVTTGTNSVAVLVPTFDSDGDISVSGSDTVFRGVAFSIVPASTWNGGSSDKYVFVETVYEGTDLTLSVSSDDKFSIETTPPADWSGGESYVLGENFYPATFTYLGTNAFNINSDRNEIKFAFYPKGEKTYFPSDQGSDTLDETPYLTSVTLRNWRYSSY